MLTGGHTAASWDADWEAWARGFHALLLSWRRGGVVFAATQALGWALFSSSLVCLIHLTVQAARGMAYCIRCWVYATGSVMLASQIVRTAGPCHCACAYALSGACMHAVQTHAGAVAATWRCAA